MLKNILKNYGCLGGGRSWLPFSNFASCIPSFVGFIANFASFVGLVGCINGCLGGCIVGCMALET